ncbi:uroporphyrin-III C-methyltransferase/precorrin-2 dehydrogenase/sirohydrochlorin ferrochelatase [Pacificibacter maritimus]|uniref:precorrin-2 dehydrogenase n=1 Tax=Pacificibacter maritimus TaxID=762213 RepID=A0A3N4UVY1_9RHOB|nr:NAD(P)-dependent oxidoreductase [Pacificibacter maritimus]RPE71659.1 uroporphyrin-III C-methyltransferase/precorrin-2 dehydrogenase/sirohydrochlorin ferrochelatase [Pacificibacter maritimus]
MKFFPMFLRMADRDVIVVGGGETAAQKARLLLKTEARITFVAPHLDDELQALVTEGRASHSTGQITPDTFRGAALTFVGTGCPGLDASIHALVQVAGALVNVVDQPHLCEANTPSLVDRDPLVVAIGTEGAAPVLARQIKTHLEQVLEPNLGDLVALGGRLRSAAMQHVHKDKRRAFWRWVYADRPRQLFARGAAREAAELIKAAIKHGAAPDDAGQGSVTVVSVGSPEPDLMTLRAVQRLQEADMVIAADPDFAPILELARRDADRLIVGKDHGTATWLLSDQRKAALSECETGARVVWLVAQRDAERASFGLSNETEIIPAVQQ